MDAEQFDRFMNRVRKAAQTIQKLVAYMMDNDVPQCVVDAALEAALMDVAQDG